MLPVVSFVVDPLESHIFISIILQGLSGSGGFNTHNPLRVSEPIHKEVQSTSVYFDSCKLFGTFSDKVRKGSSLQGTAFTLYEETEL